VSRSAIFQGGPAHLRELWFARWPLYLRVTEDHTGKIDVLDLLEDEPDGQEAISVYVRTGHGHVCGRGGGSRVKNSGWVAFYEWLPDVAGEPNRDDWRRQAEALHRERQEAAA
jgi:hypothetical protein